MPLYHFRNKTTGEERDDVEMTIAEMEKFLEDHPDWRIVIHAIGTIPDSKSPMTRAGSEWNDVLTGIRNNNPGSTIQT